MGYPEHIARKALAATGGRSTQEATDWVFAHRNDPTLDDLIPQEYVLYLCPSGPLWDKLMAFWTKSQQHCGRNQAHEVFPHVTLCHFFTCEDSKVERLYEALKKAGEKFVGRFPSCLSLSLHTSPSYIGYFFDETSADIIKQFALAFAAEATTLADCHIELYSKQLHLTLSHKFQVQQQWKLEELARSIRLGVSCQWTAAIYSRDMRFVHYQISRALYPYIPQNEDELKLNSSDYIFLDPTDQQDMSEGWVHGISHRTGCTGLLPENYTERAYESDTWVRHRTYAFCQTIVRTSTSVNEHNLSSSQSGILVSSQPQATNSIHKLLESQEPPTSSQSLSVLQLIEAASSRRFVLTMRHAERVDLVFGKSWLAQCITSEGRYIRPDLNFPPSIPRRVGGTKDYEHDAPLSSCGIFQSRLMGEAVQEKELMIQCVYSSPALRCVQTAHYVLKALQPGHKVNIRVEPGLFEWTKWEGERAIPNFMSVPELKAAEYSVDINYSVHVPVSNLIPSETYEDYINRCSSVMKAIVDRDEAGNILLVAHASTLDCCTRPLLGLPPKDSKEFVQMIRKIPALGLCCCEEVKETKKWQMIEPPVRTLTHGPNPAFSWKETIFQI
ncbi:ubiquitin-associated and SH3 domain-containing protein A-like [Carcharodon carcharias]|uniref:ubiquitin-associated and SH3 domain-containing protein A-like n=1 Tax=Carcharodon carcharias TaxID=13397 RepID=UPI001B7D9833|nr:ubiquitin-associated and SH3 domain-containing protein A-like [Carcharodon carcharias]